MCFTGVSYLVKHPIKIINCEAKSELSKGGASKSNALAVRLAPYVEGTGWRTFFAFFCKNGDSPNRTTRGNRSAEGSLKISPKPAATRR